MSLLSLRDFFPAPLPIAVRLQVRTPRCKGGRAAQVWAATGFWLVGVFPTRTAAGRAAGDFIETGPTEPDRGTPRAELPTGWNWKRSDGHAPRYKWVRKVKGPQTFQARVHGGRGVGSINLGLFTEAEHGSNSEWAAAQVAKAFMREWKPGRTVGEVVEMLKRSSRVNERVPAHVEVPDRQRDRKPPTEFGPVKSAKELRVEQTSKWVTLADFIAAA